MYIWNRYGGYEISSAGDKRFSAFYALMPDGRSIEAHYQCDVKGYAPGSNNWKLGKGKPPLDKNVDTWNEYLKLWRIWAKNHPAEMKELSKHPILSDRFAKTRINQARALATILNEMYQY